MMTLVKWLGVLGLALVASSVQDPPVPTPDNAGSIDQLAWISGTWSLEENGVVTEEHWRPLAGTTLLGTSHSYDGTETRFFEFLRISSMKGRIAYIAMPGGSPEPTVFPMVSCGDGQVTFENPKHDHPQRIRYAKTEQGITATISMLDGTRAKEFAFKKK